jgi:hypothetical protein
MAEIVLVHGIGATQSGPEVELQRWIPSLSDGVRRAGAISLAERIADPNERRLASVAHYGDLFVTTSDGSTLADDQGGQQSALEDEFALQVLRATAERAEDPRDRAEAEIYLAAREADGVAQGAGAVLRRPVQALSKIRWFSINGVAATERFLFPALRQVTTYFTNPSIRAAAQARVRDLVDSNTRVVVAHSLGSVVAYEALHDVDHNVNLVTLGSPLGTPHVVYDRLMVRPPHVPTALSRWDNFADLDDLVAVVTNLAHLFPPSPGSAVSVKSMSSLDNGSRPHDVGHYLVKKEVGEAIASAFSEPNCQ